MTPVEPDAQRLSRGLPRFVDAPLGDYALAFLASARRMLPVMAQSFPGVSEELRRLMYALESDAMDPAALMEALIQGDEAALERVRPKEVGVRTLTLAATLVLRPVLEVVGVEVARAATLGAWGRGYCPVCGALPGLAILSSSGQDDPYLKKHGGQRWLHCSQCASRWRFKRHACPHCGNEEHGTLEYFHPREHTEQRPTCAASATTTWRPATPRAPRRNRCPTWPPWGFCPWTWSCSATASPGGPHGLEQTGPLSPHGGPPAWRRVCEP
jgi:FdhE protein